MADELMSSVN